MLNSWNLYEQTINMSLILSRLEVHALRIVDPQSIVNNTNSSNVERRLTVTNRAMHLNGTDGIRTIEIRHTPPRI